ncbi:nucleotidyltransferase [bacterium]|nr:nucleotidyltransferase [bacterium]
MEIINVIGDRSAQKNLRFILVGGHAINLLGLSRQTGDIDLMIQNSDRDAWKDLLQDLGYTLANEQDAFCQFEGPKIETWPIDLMCVSESTFERVLSQSTSFQIDRTDVKVPHPSIFIAMKLHAIKNNPTREDKDFSDIINLIKIHNIKADDDFRQLCLKYGTVELYERIKSKT